MYARGQYEPPLLPDVRGQAVVVMEYGFRPNAEGHTLVSTVIPGYVKLDSRFLRAAGALIGPLPFRHRRWSTAARSGDLA